MKYVVKLGGAGLESPSLLDSCMRAIVELVRDGNQVAVVHGGGIQVTRPLKALDKQSEFVDGLRVTDAETRDIALMVFAGRVNKGLVAALGVHDRDVGAFLRQSVADALAEPAVAARHQCDRAPEVHVLISVVRGQFTA